jgi:hypothetical protein
MVRSGMDLAREYAFHNARIAIDQAGGMKGTERMSETKLGCSHLPNPL